MVNDLNKVIKVVLRAAEERERDKAEKKIIKNLENDAHSASS